MAKHVYGKQQKGLLILGGLLVGFLVTPLPLFVLSICLLAARLFFSGHLSAKIPALLLLLLATGLAMLDQWKHIKPPISIRPAAAQVLLTGAPDPSKQVPLGLVLGQQCEAQEVHRLTTDAMADFLYARPTYKTKLRTAIQWAVKKGQQRGDAVCANAQMLHTFSRLGSCPAFTSN